MHFWLRTFYFAFLLLAAPASFAGMENFTQDLNYANSIRDTVQQRGGSFKPEQVFPNYKPNPEQGKYYGGVTQSGDVAMQKDAQTTSTQDPVAKGVKDDFNTRPVYTVNQDSQEMQKSKLIEKDSYDISHGISDKYVDCNQAQTCKTVNVEKTCNEETRYVMKTCTKTPEVTVVDDPYTEEQHYSGAIPAVDKSSGTFRLPVSGTITSFDIVMKSSDVWHCGSNYSSALQGSYLSTYHPSCGDKLGDLNFHNHQLKVEITNTAPINFSLSGGAMDGNWNSANYDLTIIAKLHRKKAQVTWSEVCQNN